MRPGALAATFGSGALAATFGSGALAGLVESPDCAQAIWTARSNGTIANNVFMSWLAGGREFIQSIVCGLIVIGASRRFVGQMVDIR